MSRRVPTVHQLAARLDQLSDKLARVERALKPATKPAKPAPRASGDDVLRLVERRGAAYPPDRRGRGGAVLYAGGVTAGGSEYLWAIERPLGDLLELDPAEPAHVLATLAHPQRLRILIALIEKSRTAAELQKVIGSRSPGPLYHHLRDLLALGVVAQRERRYEVPARHVVPLLAAISLTIDLAARAS